MKYQEENYNTPVREPSTDLPLAEHKYNNDVSMNNMSEDISLKDRKDENDSKEPLWKIRYNIVMISFLTYFYTMYIRLNMSISIVAMVNNSASSSQELLTSESCPSIIQNFTESEEKNKMEEVFDWTPKIQGYILGAYAFGSFITILPSGLLTERYGVKWILCGCTLLTAACTLSIPFISYINVSLLIVNQVLRGITQGFIHPALSVIAANWYPKLERGCMFAFTMSGSSLGCCLGSILTGFICASAGGWPTSFYVTGAVGIFLLLLMLFFFSENPQNHPRISKSELNFILRNQENVLQRKRPKLPWRKMLTSIPAYVLAFTFFGQLWAMSLFWFVHSTFLATILHYPITQNGLLSALPFVLQFLVSQASSWITLYIQKKKICRVGFLRKLWTFIASVGISSCLLGMYLSGCNRTLSVIFSILCTGCTGFTFSGCWVVPNDMTPTFAGSLTGFCLLLGMPSTFIAPVVVGYITNEMQTIEQWNKVFFLSIGIVMSSGIVFALFGSAEVQPWNFVEEKNTEIDTKQIKATNEKSLNNMNDE